MKIRKIDRRVERDILIGMIVDKHYMAQIRQHVQLACFKNKYARTIASWCLEYYDKYEDVPFKKIQDIYDYHDRKGEVEEEEVSMIEKLLETISQDYTEKDNFNSQFLLDLSQEYFNRVRIENATLKIHEELESGTIAKAQEILVDASKPISLTARRAIDPLAEKNRLIAAFEKSREPLIRLPGDLGELMNENLTRASLVAIQAPEKGGKTWLLDYIKRVALEQRRNVLEVQLGDLTEGQVIIRDSISIAEKSDKKKWCGTFKKPIKFIDQSGAKECHAAPEGFDVEYEEVTIDEPLNHEEAWKLNRKYYKKHGIEPHKRYRLIVVPARTMNTKMIDAECDRLYAEEGFVPDVIILDYMDILAKENARDEGRDQINENWIGAKSIVNKRDCLIVTATQSNKESYGGDVQDRFNVSDDKRKLGHVNGMYGLNQTDIEKKFGINKMNAIIARDGDFITSEACYILQCLRCGLPVVDSLIPTLHGGKPETYKNKKEQEVEDKVHGAISKFSKRGSKRN
jgi:hypothetical protein